MRPIHLLTQQERRDLYLAWRKGWTDGAKASVIDKSIAGHKNAELAEAYQNGYTQGKEARHRASILASIDYAYQPSPLRTER
jgi:hypothetical protein